ncbi:hypothetical protein NM208_g16930 [Fusarium decemcellulare]|uniref:Uncharacterized protein n=1 Tax=Fusarium decemcellulare TaxID=57161 RepID=A0ACC1R8U4_9HYPO|nr:hypothetical protein NM208_g16930 [Fusarium decemcellulare]
MGSLRLGRSRYARVATRDDDAEENLRRARGDREEDEDEDEEREKSQSDGRESPADDEGSVGYLAMFYLVPSMDPTQPDEPRDMDGIDEDTGRPGWPLPSLLQAQRAVSSIVEERGNQSAHVSITSLRTRANQVPKQTGHGRTNQTDRQIDRRANIPKETTRGMANRGPGSSSPESCCWLHATQANRRPLVVDLVAIGFALTVAGGLTLMLTNPPTWPLSSLVGPLSLLRLLADELTCTRTLSRDGHDALRLLCVCGTGAFFWSSVRMYVSMSNCISLQTVAGDGINTQHAD